MVVWCEKSGWLVGWCFCLFPSLKVTNESMRFILSKLYETSIEFLFYYFIGAATIYGFVHYGLLIVCIWLLLFRITEFYVLRLVSLFEYGEFINITV